MSLEQTEDRPVHFPADPKKFAFDPEVAKIFEDMAIRSIPNFLQAHDCHASMARPWLQVPGATVMDVGASRGSFFRALQKHYPRQMANGDIKLHAIDNSDKMCEYLRGDFTTAQVECLDITSDEFLGRIEQYDIVCAHYVLQFIHPDKQQEVLSKIFRMVKQGGVLIFGHKAMHHGDTGALSHEEYIRFRLENGYTMEEIKAKTLALKGSMFPMKHGRLMSAVRTHFSDVSETFRFMMFSTFFAVK